MKSDCLLALKKQPVSKSVYSLSDSGCEPVPDTVLAQTSCGKHDTINYNGACEKPLILTDTDSKHLQQLMQEASTENFTSCTVQS